jgi:hypothetical protein
MRYFCFWAKQRHIQIAQKPIARSARKSGRTKEQLKKHVFTLIMTYL